MLNDVKNNNINYTTTESDRQDRERSKREDFKYIYGDKNGQPITCSACNRPPCQMCN